MSAAAQTKLFGIRIPVDPKILFGVLAAFIALLFWYNSRADDETSAPATANAHLESSPAAAAAFRARTPVSRRSVGVSNRGSLRLRPIDPTKGDIDPTLRLDLLARLASVQPVTGGRSLFEAGNQPSTGVTAVALHPPILHPAPRPPVDQLGGAGGIAGGTALAAIPLKYYGYVRPSQNPLDAKPTKPQVNDPGNNRGFFLDGDNVLVASEGEMLKQRYLVVELTPNSARLEDTQLRQPATLPVVTAALP